jgi:hypothetical protein
MHRDGLQGAGAVGWQAALAARIRNVLCLCGADTDRAYAQAHLRSLALAGFRCLSDTVRLQPFVVLRLG